MNDVYPKAVKTLAQVREGYARGGFLFADVQDAADNIIQMQAQWAEAMTTRSEEHTSELQSLMRISYAVFCLKKKTIHISIHMSISNNVTKIMYNNETHT